MRKTAELQDQISYHSNQVVQESARLEKQNQLRSRVQREKKGKDW